MNIIKECVKRGHFWIVILRTNTYAHSLKFFDELYAEIVKDFGEVAKEKIEVVQDAGRIYKRTFGIEFNTLEEPPTGYMLINETEQTL